MPDRRTASREDDVARREQELLARFRLRMARAASGIALIVVAAMAFHVAIHVPTVPAALWPLLAAAAGISAAIRVRSRTEAPPLALWTFYVWTASVLAFDTAVLYLSGDAASEVYLSYLLPVLFAAATLPTWGAAATLGAAVAAYLGVLVTLGGDLGQAELVMRIATFSVVGLLGGYLAREQQREIALRVREEQRVEALARDRGELLARAISAQEGERARIARELHDGPIQDLASVSLQLGLLEGSPSGGAGSDVPGIGATRAALRHTLTDLRRMIGDLRPSALDDVGLVPAVHDLARAQCDAHDIGLDWRVAGQVRRLAPAVETAVFRILQEGVNNVVRHSRARSARVSIAFVDGHVRASVEDDGVGFEPRRLEHAPDGRRVGLLGMQERATLLGGRLEVASTPGRGARVTAEIPVGATDG